MSSCIFILITLDVPGLKIGWVILLSFHLGFLRATVEGMYVTQMLDLDL